MNRTFISYEQLLEQKKVFDASGIDNPEEYLWVEKAGVYYPQKEVIETMDCTPTWAGLLSFMLEIHAQFYNKVRGGGNKRNAEDNENYDNVRKQFLRMAQAADFWNEHCKAMNKNKLLLKSVGCFMVVNEQEEPIIYTAMKDLKTMDEDTGVNLSDCTEEWFKTLSNEDKQLVWDTFKIEID